MKGRSRLLEPHGGPVVPLTQSSLLPLPPSCLPLQTNNAKQSPSGAGGLRGGEWMSAHTHTHTHSSGIKTPNNNNNRTIILGCVVPKWLYKWGFLGSHWYGADSEWVSPVFRASFCTRWLLVNAFSPHFCTCLLAGELSKATARFRQEMGVYFYASRSTSKVGVCVDPTHTRPVLPLDRPVPGWDQLCQNSSALLFSPRVDKKRDKIERKILDSQERAFWDVHRPVVGEAVFFIIIKIIKRYFFLQM